MKHSEEIMAFIDLEKILEREVVPGFLARFVHSEFMTISYWDVKEGHTLPEHSHPHEQITTVIRGTFKLTIDGESKIIEAGSVAIIPSGSKHSGESLTDCYIIDVFYPIREDFK